MIPSDTRVEFVAPCPGCGNVVQWVAERRDTVYYKIACEFCYCPTRRAFSKESGNGR